MQNVLGNRINGTLSVVGKMEANTISSEHLFVQYLQNGEKILWCCRPERSIVWENWRKSLVQIFLGLGFLISGLTVIILPWILFVTNRPIDSQQMRVFAITTPLITIVGLFFAWAGLSGLGVIDYIRRKWTKGEVFYAVTDSRVLVLSIGLHAKVIALSLTSIKEFFSQNNFDGTGSLLLVSSSGKKMELTGLKEVERVRDVIKQQQSLSRETSG